MDGVQAFTEALFLAMEKQYSSYSWLLQNIQIHRRERGVLVMSWEKEIREYKSRIRVIKAQEKEIEKEYAELRKETVKEYLRAGRGIEDPELEEEMEELSRQEREEIMALYSKPKKGCDNDDYEF